jgi:hypothetical protein
MRTTLSNEQLVIYDDFLPQATIDALLDHVNRAPFSSVHETAVRKVWRLGDGMPLTGPTTYYRPAGKRYARHERPRHPTGTAIDLFVDAVKEMLPAVSHFTGPSPASWDAMSVTPYVYTAGTSLGLHRDGRRYAGSYAYYLHGSWDFHWGGHLLILDPATSIAPPEYALPWVRDNDENRIVSEPGLATCVLAKPNRLVFIAPEAIHMITPVSASAGNRPRISISGVFHRPER